MDSDITDSYGYLVKKRGEPYPADAKRISNLKASTFDMYVFDVLYIKTFMN